MTFATYCFYDNPRKWQRELWLDGKLFRVWSVSVVDRQSDQPWNAGEIVGDASAMPSLCYTCGVPEPGGDGRCRECWWSARENDGEPLE